MLATCRNERVRRRPSAHQRGFALPAAIFLMVILALLGAFIVRINTIQLSSFSLDALGTGAYQAGRAGTEWGAYQVLRGANVPPAGCFVPTNLTFAATSLTPFTATVSCTRTSPSPVELTTTITIDQITATACNQPAAGGSCPNNAPGANYVERQITITVAQ